MDKKMAGRWEELRERVLNTPEKRERYERNKRALILTRQILMQIDAERERAGLSKAELARRIGATPSVVRRVFSAEASNPTLRTVLDMLSALDMAVELRPARGDTQRGAPRGGPRTSEKRKVAI